MNELSGEGGGARAFAIFWIVLPAAGLGVALAAAPDWDPLAAVAFPALFLAGLAFPFVLERRSHIRFSGVLSWLLLQAPFFLAGGRLSGAGWRAAAAFLLVGIWLVLAWACAARFRGKRWLPEYLAFFAFLGGLPPLLDYLLRDFGGAPPPWLSEISSFVFVWRLVEGRGYGLGAAFSLLWAAAAWSAIRFRAREVWG